MTLTAITLGHTHATYDLVPCLSLHLAVWGCVLCFVVLCYAMVGVVCYFLTSQHGYVVCS